MHFRRNISRFEFEKDIRIKTHTNCIKDLSTSQQRKIVKALDQRRAVEILARSGYLYQETAFLIPSFFRGSFAYTDVGLKIRIVRKMNLKAIFQDLVQGLSYDAQEGKITATKLNQLLRNLEIAFNSPSTLKKLGFEQLEINRAARKYYGYLSAEKTGPPLGNPYFLLFAMAGVHAKLDDIMDGVSLKLLQEVDTDESIWHPSRIDE